jgi:hypothetical protein
VHPVANRAHHPFVGAGVIGHGCADEALHSVPSGWAAIHKSVISHPITYGMAKQFTIQDIYLGTRRNLLLLDDLVPPTAVRASPK